MEQLQRMSHSSAGCQFPVNFLSDFETTLSSRSNQRARRGHTLPGSMELYPCVHKSFAVHVGLPLLRPFDSKHSDDYGDIPVHLDIALLDDGLRRLIVWRLDTCEEFALGGNASVDVDGYERICQEHVQRLGVFCLLSVIPCILKRHHAPAFVAHAALLRRCYAGNEQQYHDS